MSKHRRNQRSMTPQPPRKAKVLWCGATAVRVTACATHGEATDNECPGCREALRRIWYANQCANNRREKLKR